MASPRKLRKIARRDARRYGVDPNVFERQINKESGFQVHVTSPAGAQGIAQFMPGTARSEHVDPNNPRQALKGAARLDAKLIKQLGYRKGLAAYNAGPANIGAGLGYADSILSGQSPKGRPSPGGGSRSTTRSTTTTTPGVDNSQARQQLVAQYLAGNHSAAVGGDPLTALKQSNNAGVNLTGLIANLQQNQDVPGTSVTTRSRSSSGHSANTSASGVAHFDGKPVAAWIKPELVKARRAGWKGSVTSGERSRAEQARIYNSGVRPAARPGTSNHEKTAFPGGAVDVTNAAQLSAILRRLHSPLKWAGSKDPVHFSHPHGGSY